MLIEPILGNCCGIPSKPEFIKAVRALCTKYNVVMIVDEVKTGFRVGKGGAQALYGIEADIFTVAKAMANGYPISAIGGKEEIMRKYGKGVAHGGTYTAQAMSLAAAEKTLTILQGHRRPRPTSPPMARRCRRAWARSSPSAASPTASPAITACAACSSRPRRRPTYRNWKLSDYTFYDTMARLSDRHGRDVRARQPRALVHLRRPTTPVPGRDPRRKFEEAVDLTLDELGREHGAKAAPLMAGISN